MSTSRRVAKNFLSLSLAEIGVRLLGTILSIYVARVLGRSAFGELAFATAFISFFNIFADFGLTQLGIRDIAQDKSRTNSYGSTILILQILFSFFLIAIILGISLILPLSYRERWIVILFGLTLIPYALNMSYIFQAHEQMEFMATSKIFAQVVYVVIGFVLVWYTRDIIVLPIATLIGLIAGSWIVWHWLKNKIVFKWELMNWSQIKQLLKQTLPFLITAVAIQIYYNFDSIILRFMKGTEIVGLYGSAYKIVLLVIMVGSFVNGAFFPLLSATAGNDKVTFNRSVIEWSRIAGILAFPISVGGFIMAKPIINLIYGSEFNQATAAFTILILLPIIIFINGVMGAPLVAMGRQDKNTIAVVIGAIINIILNFILIPRYGMIGAAWATVGAELMVFGYLWVMFEKFISVNIIPSYMLKPLLASSVMGIILVYIQNSLPVILSIVIGGCIYLIALLTVGGLTVHDARLLLGRTVKSESVSI